MFNFDKSSVGLFLGLMAAVCYGFIPLFTKELQAPAVGLPLSSSTILFYRFGIASLILAAIMCVRRESFRITYAEFVRFGAVGLFEQRRCFVSHLGLSLLQQQWGSDNAPFHLSDSHGAHHDDLFRERSRLSTWIAIGLSIAGVALLSGVGGGAQWLGIVLEIISALCFALYLIRVNRSRVSQMPVVKLTFYVMAFGALIFAAFIAYERADFDISAHYALIPSASAWLNLCLLSVICTVVTNLALVYATQNVGPTVASILGVLEPLTALVLGILFLGEELTPSMAAGIGLILPAVLIIILRRKA